MNFSFGRKKVQEPSTAKAGSSPMSPANDKLRKAIERNRAKMAKRQATGRASSSMSAPPPHPTSSNGSLADRLRASSSSRPRPTSPQSAPPPSASSSGSSSLLEKMRMRKEGASTATSRSSRPASMSSSASASGSPATRRTIANTDNIELSQPLRKATTAPAEVSYGAQSLPSKSTGTVRAKRKVKTRKKAESNVSGWFLKSVWAFVGFLLVRLVFSEGGVVDYYDKRVALDHKQHELELALKENDNLMTEIESIKTDMKYRKKLVRDHLGYIAKDEFLIIFPKNEEMKGPREYSSI